MLTVDPDEEAEQRVRTALADELRDAFASVDLPTPPVTTSSGNDYVERALAGKPANLITPEDARHVLMDLWLLTPEAYRYYLPALLRIHLTGSTFVDGLGSFAFRTLIPPDDPALEIFERRMALLDDRQHRALAGYVAWYLDYESSVPRRDAAAAASYWLRAR